MKFSVPPSDLEAQPRPTLFAYGTAQQAVAIQALTVAVCAVVLVAVASVWFSYRVSQSAMNREPLFVAVAKDGSFKPIDNSTLRLQMDGDEMLRSQLQRFVREYLERIPGRSETEFPHSLVYLDQTKARSLQDRNSKPLREIKALQENAGNEIIVKPLNVSLRNTQNRCADDAHSYCQATVSIEKTIRSNMGRAELVVHSDVELVFMLKYPKVPKWMVDAENWYGIVVLDIQEYAPIGAESGQ